MAGFRDSKHTSKGRRYWTGNPAAVTNRHSLPDHLSLISIQPFHPRPFHATTAVGVLFALAPCPSPDIDKVEEIERLRERLEAADAYTISHTKRSQVQRPARRHVIRRLICRPVLIVLAWRMGSNARWSEDWAITGMIMRYCIPIGLTASASYDDHITGGPGAPGMADIGSPIIPTEMSPTSSSNVTPNMDLPTPNPANDNRPGPDAFSASGLTFNGDGSINFGLVDEAGAYNAGFGLDPASASGSVGTHAIMRRGH
ncbi:hypothetical protein RhiXN_10855 [Rhizoctonia solani]|uniref:Uncharacterized protein n=1 Tax=Rhizoctonia solani TaxID=456999 RepID=A0A8H8P8J3_9AGAM|nr:uncharacterized protein RhiXN_10855 [Rhizoctonia solani]QRW25778.1 hypothetical protein RhiXN_10855 [Rhizoctonia solani]